MGLGPGLLGVLEEPYPKPFTLTLTLALAPTLALALAPALGLLEVLEEGELLGLQHE